MTNQFRLGGDLSVNRLGFGAMRLPRNGWNGPARDPATGRAVLGLIRHLGLSNVDSDHLAEARAIAPVAAVQNSFHVAKRDDVAVLDACAKSGMAFAPFGPVGSGRTDFAGDHLARVAARHGATLSQIALAWLIAVSPATLAIPGTGSIAHLEENMAARSIALTADDLTELER